MRTLVTGGAGFIGAHLAEALLAAGHEVLVVDDLSRGAREHVPDEAELALVDVATAEAERLVLDYAPEAVFHHAAQIDVRRSVADPASDAECNVVGTVRLLTAAARAKCALFVMASSGGAIYGEQRDFPADEGHPTKPESPYGIGKLCAELYLGLFARQAGLRAVALRYANVYGPGQDSRGEAGVVAIFCERLLAGEPLVIYGDGDQTRDFVYIDDVVRANLLALEHPDARGSYNIGTARETSVKDLARLLCEGRLPRLEHRAPRLGEQRRSAIESKRAEIDLGWRPAVPLEDGLRRTLAWYREQKGA